MTPFKNMADYVKIRVPAIIDDPIVGRCSCPTSILGPLDPMNILSGIDYIIIKDGKLGFKCGLESTPKSIFKIDEIEKILIIKRKASCWTADHKIDLWVNSSAGIEVSILLKSGERHVLIPNFFLRHGKKDWDTFLKELSDSSGLFLEEINEYTKKK
jgi:hypothetical protein